MLTIILFSLLSFIVAFEFEDLLNYYHLDLDLVYRGKTDKTLTLTHAGPFGFTVDRLAPKFSIGFNFRYLLSDGSKGNLFVEVI
jgi:hypothetical protein